MTKEKHRKGDPKDHWSSLTLDLDAVRLALDSVAQEEEEPVKKAKRGRPRKNQVDPAAEKPVKKTTRKRASKTEKDVSLVNDPVSETDEKLDFAIGAAPAKKRPRGRPRKTPLPAPPVEEPVNTDPWSSFVAQLDKKVEMESELPPKTAEPVAPIIPVPDLTADDFSLEDFFASDDELEIAWGKKDKESSAPVKETPLAAKEKSSDDKKGIDAEESFGFRPKEKEQKAAPDRERWPDRKNEPARNRDRDRDRDRSSRRDQDYDRDKNRNRERGKEKPIQDAPVREEFDRHGRDRNRDKRRGYEERRPPQVVEEKVRPQVVEEKPRSQAAPEVFDKRPQRHENERQNNSRRPRREEEAKQAPCQPLPDTPFAGIFDDNPPVTSSLPARPEKPVRPEKPARSEKAAASKPERENRPKVERPQFSSWDETIDSVVRFNLEKHASKRGKRERD